MRGKDEKMIDKVNCLETQTITVANEGELRMNQLDRNV